MSKKERQQNNKTAKPQAQGFLRSKRDPFRTQENKLRRIAKDAKIKALAAQKHYTYHAPQDDTSNLTFFVRQRQRAQHIHQKVAKRVNRINNEAFVANMFTLGTRARS